MKFCITFKDADGPSNAIHDLAKSQVEATTGLFDDEKEQAIEQRVNKLNSFIGKWCAWGEYVTIEFDTDTQTAKVLKSDE